MPSQAHIRSSSSDVEQTLITAVPRALVLLMNSPVVAFTRKAGEVVGGLFSRNLRARSAARLLAFALHRLPVSQLRQFLEYAPRLPDNVISNAKLFADREAMLAALPEGGTVAEVGVYRGDFARSIIAVCRPAKLHLIDIDLNPLTTVGGPVETHEGDSATILDCFPQAHFDWIYIDGDHSHAGISRDLDSAHRVLKPGGFLMCNDYSNWCSASATPYGVARAVNEFIVARNYEVCGLALHPAGLHDILIRKT